MSIPQNILSQQGVVDNLNSTEAAFPLSANMGRFLQQEINAIAPVATFTFERQFVVSGVQDLSLIDLPTGTLKYSVTNLQPYIELTDTNINALGVFNNSILEQSSGSFIRPDPTGQFNVAPLSTAYFTADGLVNSSVRFLQPVSRTTVEALFYSSATDVVGLLSFDLKLQSTAGSTETLLLNGFYTTYNLIQPLGIRAEFNDAGGLIANDYQFSYGNNEADPEGGIILPYNARLLEYGIFWDTAPASPGVIAQVMLNGVGTTNSEILTTGIISESGLFSAPLAIPAGARINIRTAATDATVLKGTITLVGELILEE